MKGITTLIKLNRRKLDALRRQMMSLEKQKQDFRDLIVALQEELAKELELSGQQPEMAHFYGDFADRIRKRQEKAVLEIMELDKKMLVLSREIAEAFTEVKKFEIHQENTKKKAEIELLRQETAMLDDIAAIQHRRKTTDRPN